MTKTINITEKEADLMQAMMDSDFMENEITDPIWAWSAYVNVSMAKTSIGGVVTSLVKKGMIFLSVDDEGDKDEDCLHFEPAGAEWIMSQPANQDNVDNKNFNPEGYGKGNAQPVTPSKPEPKKAAPKKETAVAGINRPTREGACLTAWNTFDLTPKATRQEQIAAAMEAGVTAGTSGTQFNRWKRFSA